MERKFRIYSRFAASAAALISILTLVGMILDRPRLAIVFFGSMSMSANTALGFLILGSLLALFGLDPIAKWQNRLVRVGAYFVFGLALMTFSQHVFGWNLGIDHLIHSHLSRPARMSPITACSFALLALAIALFAHRRGLQAARAITGLVGMAAFFALFGYFYEIPAWYEIEPHAPTTLQTAIGFVLLVLSCMFALPDQGLMAIASSDTDAGGLARRFLPAALVVPFVIGWFALVGEERGSFGPEIADALSTMVLIAFFFGLVVFQVKKLHRSEMARSLAEAQVRESREELVRANEDLEHKVQERTARLQETVADLEHFSYSITHDMRAPLRALQGFGRLLQESQLAAAAQESDYIRRIISSAERMDKLIRDALNYSKVVRQEMDLAPLDPTHMLREMIDTYPAFQPPGAEIQIEGEFPMVRANEAGLTQCFSNLLGNAVKFVEPGRAAHVRIWASRIDDSTSTSSPGHVRIFLQDDGIGIPAHATERIFGMFQRLNKEYEGTGIGLTMVRKVAERMGGRVGVESELGHGSKFWLDLQLAS